MTLKSPAGLSDTAVTVLGCNMYTRKDALGFTLENSYCSYDLLAKLMASFCKCKVLYF